MSPRPPRVTAAEIIRVLEKRRFTLSRQSGSHRIYIDEAGNRVTVPFHSGKILHPKVLKNILNDAGLSIEEFMQLL